MLPTGTVSDIFYPMTADIYYAVTSQTALGEMSKSWSFDRTIKCSAVKERPESSIPTKFQAKKFIEYDSAMDFRTPENILISTDDTNYRITDILITNIKDPAGIQVWMETANQSTNFEINNIEPMYDPFHKLFGYRVLLLRSNEQVSVYD